MLFHMIVLACMACAGHTTDAAHDLVLGADAIAHGLADADADAGADAGAVAGELGGDVAFEVDGDSPQSWRRATLAAEDAARFADYADAPVDINTASAVVLAGLPTLGPRDAQAIIAGRPYDTLQALVARHILDAERLDALAPLLYASVPQRAWVSQMQSRTWWGHDAPLATGLSATTGNQAWRVGAAMATQPTRWQPMGHVAPASLAPQDAFILHTTGAHTWVLGYYDLGFADRLLFDTTGRATPDGIARGRPALAQRAPNLLGGAYVWQQYPGQARGLVATAFAAAHPSFSRLGGAHLAFTWDARTQVGLTAYLAQGEQTEAAPTQRRAAPALGVATGGAPAATLHQAVGVMARLGLGLCDAASEGAWLVGAHALAYALGATCELRQGLRLDAQWRDLQAGFDNPRLRVTRGRPVGNRRAMGLGGRLHAPLGHGSARVDVSWPRSCARDAALGGPASCAAPSLSVREEGRWLVHPRHVLDATARTWRHKARRQEILWNHRISLRWRYGATRGWGGTLGTAWQRHPTSVGSAHVIATTRLGWRHPALAVEAHASAGLDAAHWRAGVWLAHRLSQTSSVQLRAQVGQSGVAQPLHYASAVVAKMTF